MTSPSSGSGLRFGLIFFSSRTDPSTADHPYQLLLESARFADRHGFSSVWVPERHFTPDGWLYPNPSVVAAALARETSRIGLRAGSVVVPLHHPARIVEEWAVVDQLSGGRVGISFASGWHPGDFVFFPDRYAKRHEHMRQGIDLVRALWRGVPTTLPGGDGPVTVRTYPPPVQPELPFWITAAGNPATFEQAGVLGGNLLTHLFNQSTEELAGRIALYRQARRRHGHDGPGQVTVMVHTFVTDDVDVLDDHVGSAFREYLKSASYLLAGVAASRGQQVDVRRLSPQDVDEYVRFVYDRMLSSRRLLFGTPESCHAVLRELRAAGVDEIACQLDFGPAAGLVLDSLPALDRLRQWAADLGPVPTGSPDPPVAPADAPAAAPVEPQPTDDTVAAIRARCADEHSGAEFYDRLTQRGVQLGPGFQGVRRLWRRDGEALGEVELADHLAGDAAAYRMHPALLDACLHVLIAAVPMPDSGDGLAGLHLPVGIRGFEVYRRPAGRVFSHATAVWHAAQDLVGDVRLLDADGALLARATGIQLRPVQGLTAPGPARTADIFYAVRWDAVGLDPAPMVSPRAGRWLVFADDDLDGVAGALRPLLTDGGTEPVLAVPGPAYDIGREGAPWRIRPGSLDDMRRLITSAGPWRGVIHLWSLRADPPGKGDVMAAAELSCGSALHLVQSLASAGLAEPPRIWLATRGAQPVLPGDPVDAPAQAPLWGLGRALAFEHPALWGGLVDLDPAAPVADLAAALRHAVDHGDEDEIAVRDGRYYAARLARIEVPSAGGGIRCRPDAAYLITGGLGDLGLVVARWLVDHGARHLVLLSRTGLPGRDSWDATPADSPVAARIAAVRALEEHGVEVVTAGVDVADAAALRACLAEVTGAAGRPPIRGVVHAAATVHGAILLNLDPAALLEVLWPKVSGGWLLHQVTAGWDLDFFLLFSALPATFGWLAQGAGNYAAANAFLDALAAHRRAAGRTALSIGWGPWVGVGLAQRAEGGLERLASHGVGTLSSEQGRAALDRLVGDDRAHVVVAAIDWLRTLRVAPALVRSPLLRELVERLPDPTADAGRSTTRDTLLALPAAEQRNWLSAYARGKVAEVLHTPPERLDVDQPLSDVGLDSLMAIELKNRLEGELGVHVSMVTFLQGPSIRRLAAEVMEQLHTAGPAAPEVDRSPETAGLDPDGAARMLARLDELSDDEVALALAHLAEGHNSS